MRKIVVSTYVTLDGAMEEPQNWSGQFWNDEHTKYADDLLFASDALILGRETYEVFADSWPSRDGQFADRINHLPKFVASTTLKAPLEWNNSTLIKEDVSEEVSKLKQQPGQDILMYGCGDLALELMQHGLIDELRLWIFPVVWRSGERLFKNASDIPTLRLVDTKTLSSGVVVLTYQPERKE